MDSIGWPHGRPSYAATHVHCFSFCKKKTQKREIKESTYNINWLENKTKFGFGNFFCDGDFDFRDYTVDPYISGDIKH